nr:hypothetical protein [Tanacetum cinerariifolium]
MAARGQNRGKGKNKQAYAPMPKIPPLPKRENPAKDSTCHKCGEIGRWKRNCPQYLAELLKKKKNATSGASGSGVISVSRLYEDGFINRFMDNTIQVSRNNVVYFSAVPRDGIFEIDLSNSLTNESSIYAVSNKRAKLDLDSTLLWHCRIGHISKKCIEKLQHDGLLDSFDLRAFEKCVSCMSGKLARKPYTHQVERAKGLLGLIHTDVCGLFKIMSRQGASYFITFTDDFSRYGYVYLLKHKHEVFEYFKVFQKEVENQLGKTIKLLCSDRGGKYMSQEFLDHLKDHWIIAHRTPPDTPHHNGVLERRNRTLLDMVRSMMSQTTLPNLINQETSGSLEDLEIIQEEDTHPFIDTSLNQEEGDLEIDKPQSDIVPISRSTRTRHAPNRMCLYIDAEEHELGDLEMQSMKDNEVWVLVELPPNGKTVGSKWLFKKKSDMDGNVHIYKARLVAKGYTQTLGIDYEETFFPVADIRAIRILIAIAAYYDYEIWQMDVKTDFLNGYLNEESVKTYLEKWFAMKDLGEAAYILGIKIYRDRSRRLIDLCQSTYIEKILKRYCMENSKRGSSIRCAVRCTRLDFAFAQNVTSRFQQNPVYGGDKKRELRVSCYTDAGYLTDADDLKSQTRYVLILNGGAVDWKSAKQNIFATSFAEAEYIASFDASKEAVWVRKFISGLGVVPTIEEPTSMYYANTRAITIANESGITKGARHFCDKVHYLREVIEYAGIKLEKVHTDDNLTDPFTKALVFPKHLEHTRNIGMLPTSSLIGDNLVTTVSYSFAIDLESKEIGRSGGLLLIWDSNVSVVGGERFIAAKGNWKGVDGDVMLVNVYGTHVTEKKMALWDRILALINTVAREIQLGGRKYTRISDDGLKFRNLDRFLVTPEFSAKWDNLSVIALDRKISDHCPILLKDMDLDYWPKPFWVSDLWLKDREINVICVAQDQIVEAKSRNLNDDELEFWMKARKEWVDKENGMVPKLLVDDAASLELPFSKKEVWDMVCNCGGNKAPGPDGFNFKYIKRFWDIIKGDVTDPLGLGDYRPISLIGSLYKIIAKLLAERIKRVIGKVIGEVQNAFIEGRYILDGVLVANETMEFLKKKA